MLLSCGNGYEFWDISKFLIKKNALENNEEIKLLYTSRGPDFNTDKDYYIHLIVVSQKTGDTVNILTTTNNNFTEADKDKVFNYFNQDSDISKISEMDPDKIKELKHVDDLKDFEYKKIDKVARDPKFDDLADNKHPTVFGSIGTSIPIEK